MRIKKYLFLILIVFLLPRPMYAEISELTITPSTVTVGDEIVLNPTISSVPSGTVYVCWGLYNDAECTDEVSDISFRGDLSLGKNAVKCTMPSTAGTYYIRTSLHTGYKCLLNEIQNSHLVTPITVHPLEEVPTSLESTMGENGDTRKVLIGGKLYILRGGNWYDTTGALVRLSN